MSLFLFSFLLFQRAKRFGHDLFLICLEARDIFFDGLPFSLEEQRPVLHRDIHPTLLYVSVSPSVS